MRSRYSAFAVGESDYLVRTWHSTTRPAHVRLDPAQRWTRLDILSVDGGSLFDNTGTVEFRAHYRLPGRSGSVHERSRFQREDGRWRYIGGVSPPGPRASLKVAR